MSATDTQETGRVAALLTAAMAGSMEAAMHFNDVADSEVGPDGKAFTPQVALTLLGMAHAARYAAESAVKEADRCAEVLMTQYHIAEQAYELAGGAS